MASKGKKGKKNKWLNVPLTDLIPETPGGMPTMPVKVPVWAESLDDESDMYTSRKPQEPVVLPTAPRAARGPGIDEENIPTSPPFVAYISNLPYDVLEEDLAEFFADMQVTNMRLPKDSTKLKGYGYVDFEDRQSLIDALSMTNTTIKGRRVRIEVSNSNNEERRGRMNRDFGRRENYDDADRNTDWRSAPRDELPSGENDRFRSRGFDRGDRREERDGSASDNRPGAWREGRTPLPDLPDRGGSSYGERRGYRSYDDRGSKDRDGGDRGGGSSFGPRRNYGGDRDRDRDRNFGGDRDRDRNQGGDRESDWGNRLSARPPSSSDTSAAEPRTRVKLNLQPRTKPLDPPAVKDETTQEDKEVSKKETPASAPVPAANIFGAAKPVDTAAREREIEERLAKTYADNKQKAEDGERKGPQRDAGWGRRNGEGRGDYDREKSRSTWRSEDEKDKQVDKSSGRQASSGRSDGRNDLRGQASSRSETSASHGGQKSNESRGPPERERKNCDREDGVPPMPKATDEEAPNFVASNKYSMLHEDADSDNSCN